MTWKSVELGDLAVRRGGSVNPKKHPDETFELFSIPAFDTGQPDIVQGSEIGSSKKAVQPNDVLISRIVPHIRRSWVVGPANGHRQIASGEWIIFRSEEVWPNYLRHFLVCDGFHKAFMRTVSGVGGSLLRARPPEVYKIKVPIPPLPEQKRIAAILDTADALRAKRRETLAELDTLLQSTFLEMFGDPAANPRKWETSSLGDVTSIEAPMVDPRQAEFQGLLHYGPDRIKKDSGELLPAQTAFEEQLKSGKFLCSPGEILYSKIRPYLNKVALVKEKCLCSADVYPVRPDESVITKEYLWLLLRSKAFLDYVASFSRRANIPKLNRKQFAGYEAPIPPMATQKHFKAIAQSVEQQQSRLRAHLDELDTLFAALQARAFAGEL
ncbi:MAG: restriction endonuclease subunit S [Pseudomonadota bacterium]|nr:MAG: restriction endonuclease subunit S [Pseudomonadota bacterium]